MSIRNKALLTVFSLTAAFIVALYLLSYTVFLSNYNHIDETYARDHLNRVLISFDGELTAMSTGNQDWAVWDDTYQFMSDQNEPYILSNLKESVFQNYQLDLMVYANPNGDIIWGQGYDLIQNSIASLPADLDEALHQPGSPLMNPINSGQTLKGIVYLSGKPNMVVANPILTSDGNGPPRGLLIWGRPMDNQMATLLQQETTVPVVLRPVQGSLSTDLNSVLSELEQNGQPAISIINPQNLDIYSLLNDIYGQPAVMVQVETPRDFYQQGLATVNSYGIVLAIAGLVMGLLVYFTLSKTTITPLGHLSSSVQDIGKGHHYNNRVAVSGKDEIAMLGRSINNTLDELEASREKLARSSREWRTTFDSIKEMVSIMDTDFKILRINKAFADAFGKTPEELIGGKCCKIMHGLAEPLPNCPLMQTLRSGKPSMLEINDVHQNIHLEESTYPILDENGNVTAVVRVARDISERKKMEDRLIVADRLASIGELVAGVAHELNNPLTSVIGFSELLLKEDDIKVIKEELGIINREAKRTSNIVKNLLTFARKHAPTKQVSSITKNIDEVLQIRAYEHKVNNIEIVKHYSDDLPPVMVDYFQMQQVFLNLIVNAEQAMLEAHKHGVLTITVEKVGESIKITFSDDGPGIPPENIPRIFNPFFTTKDIGKGTGLGLSICHGIVTSHGGTITAQSQVGKGTRFIIELPLSSPPEALPTLIPEGN